MRSKFLKNKGVCPTLIIEDAAHLVHAHKMLDRDGGMLYYIINN